MEENKKQSIKDWSADDRPREKLIRNGARSLSDAELLAILISTGTREHSALDLAKLIMASAGNHISELGKKSPSELMQTGGIKTAKAVTIAAALELGRRRKDDPMMERYKISSSKDAFNLMYPIIADLNVEEFWIAMVDQSNRLIEKEVISQGGITGTVVDVRNILKKAILAPRACSIFLFHNHPSGNLQPSEQDINITKKIKEAGLLMDIRVLDHLIISGNKYYSFADEGII